MRVPVRPVAGRANGHRHRRGGLLFAAQRRLFSRLHAQRVPAGLFIRLLAVQKTRVPVAHVLRLPVRGARHQPGAHAAVAEYHVRQRFRDFRHAAYQKCR